MDGYRITNEVGVMSERETLYRTLEEVARQLQLLRANLREVNGFVDKFKVTDVANGADAVRAAWALTNACSALEEVNMLTNTAFERVGWKSNASHVQQASSSSQGGRLLLRLRRRCRDHRR